MYHEILMALNGLPGSLCFDSPDGLKISSCIPNLHPGEKVILERLCVLGTKYKFLNDFLKKHKICVLNSSDGLCGLYLKSFCAGAAEVLNVYQKDTVEIETEIIKEPFLPLTHFLKLEKYDCLFNAMSDIVNKIISEKIHGCRILDLLHQSANSGIPLVEASMNKILQYCHTVMFNQVLYWIIASHIEDPYQEFFIQEEKNKISTEPVSDDCFESSLNIRYEIKPELLPAYIPSNLAEQILCVGKYMHIIKATGSSALAEEFLTKEEDFAKKIGELMQKSSFPMLSFQTTINEISRSATEQVWTVLGKKSNVVNHLKILKNFYLLGHGELFLEFICEASYLLRMPVTTNAESDIRMIFESNSHRLFQEEDSFADKFHISFQTKPKRNSMVDKESISKAKLDNGWSCISLEHEIPHPLHIFITPDITEKYNMIFRFLLNVRKVQIELHQCWPLQMVNKSAGQDSSMAPLWKLRSHMSFLVDNLQYYIMVDVLESNFSILLEQISSSSDFEAVRKFHATFLSNIKSQCFRELLTVQRSIDEVLDLCSSFCNLMTRINGTLSQKDIKSLEGLKLNFQRQTSLLFRILHGVRSHQVSPHLAQFTVRIDYNNYLSDCSMQLGGKK